ncbi:hypothetical protein [Galbibacter sp. BG1]
MQDFFKDLKYGEQFEKLILKKVQKKYPNAHKIEGNHKEYDILINDKISLEVKVDNKAIETNNILIESECNGKPSGITTTKASHWVFITHQKVIWVETIKLKKLLKKYKDSYYTIQGDWQAKRGYFLPHNELLDISTHYPTPPHYIALMPTILTKSQIKNRIKEIIN